VEIIIIEMSTDA
jgi:hypothetical protein